jgi:hypothetical protein
MKKRSFIQTCIIALMLFGCQQSNAQKPENWTADQLMEPATLAAAITANKDVPIIYNVGPGAIIPHSIDMGMGNDDNNIKRFKEAISKLPKTANIVVYCGCCPFEKCPNVRPAIAALHEMKFTNYHLLNLPHNIKTDWISKGYPQVKE